VTPLETKLRERIAREGPLSFRDVMDAALYDPEHGYYTNLRGFGPDGDFITSPERHPAFGWLLGRQALDVWQALGQPTPFRILEIGGGSGALAASLLRCVRSAVADVVYTLDERSPSLQAVQQERLTDRAFRWDAPATPAHFVIANEVADALPVHRGIIRAGRIHELLVGVEDNTLSWVEADRPNAAMEAYVAATHYKPAEGSIVDVCLGLEEWLRGLIIRMDERSAGLILDYAASPPRDSLLTYYRHTMGSDALIRLGEQDISVHVDLRTLVRLAIAQGLRAGATAQRGLLLNLGFQQVYHALPSMTDRQALGQLADPDGLGGKIAVLFLIRGVPEYKPVGAIGRSDWPAPVDVPSLPPDPDENAFFEQWREAFPATDQEEPV
jgi:SAM-dependent MidA family methyltransferase